MACSRCLVYKEGRITQYQKHMADLMIAVGTVPSASGARAPLASIASHFDIGIIRPQPIFRISKFPRIA